MSERTPENDVEMGKKMLEAILRRGGRAEGIIDIELRRHPYFCENQYILQQGSRQEALDTLFLEQDEPRQRDINMRFNKLLTTRNFVEVYHLKMKKYAKEIKLPPLPAAEPETPFELPVLATLGNPKNAPMDENVDEPEFDIFPDCTQLSDTSQEEVTRSEVSRSEVIRVENTRSEVTRSKKRYRTDGNTKE